MAPKMGDNGTSDGGQWNLTARERSITLTREDDTGFDKGALLAQSATPKHQQAGAPF
jgi:hypothetical protein